MQLFINTRGCLLKKRGDRFLVKTADKSHEFSAKKLSTIVVATSVCITSDVIQLSVENNIPIVFLNKSGEPQSRVWQTRMGSTSRIRIEQLNWSMNGCGIALARNWIQKKLQNQIEFLKELKQRRSSSCGEDLKIQSLESNLEKLSRVASSSLDTELKRSEFAATIRGLEGTAGRSYFGMISKLLPQKYRFVKRSRRPAEDPYNAMLNYSYGVLYSQVENALILAGLDPFIGFFHTNDYNQPSLVFDVVEAFRIIGERTTTLMFTGKRVKDEYFREIPGGIELSPSGRAELVDSLNKRLEKTVRYPVQKKQSRPGPPKTRNLKLRDTIRHEAHRLANQLLGRTDIPSVVTTENLFGET